MNTGDENKLNKASAKAVKLKASRRHQICDVIITGLAGLHPVTIIQPCDMAGAATDDAQAITSATAHGLRPCQRYRGPAHSTAATHH
jgi:hypothetical protein